MSNNPDEQTPRVAACIARLMALYPNTGTVGLDTYNAAVHRELLPLARELERELNACRAKTALPKNNLFDFIVGQVLLFRGNGRPIDIESAQRCARTIVARIESAFEVQS